MEKLLNPKKVMIAGLGLAGLLMTGVDIHQRATNKPTIGLGYSSAVGIPVPVFAEPFVINVRHSDGQTNIYTFAKAKDANPSFKCYNENVANNKPTVDCFSNYTSNLIELPSTSRSWNP